MSESWEVEELATGLLPEVDPAQVAEEMIPDTNLGTIWIEMPQEAVDARGDCDGDCDRYHHHWHCNIPGVSCVETPAKPVVSGLTARKERAGILAGNIWGGAAMCLRHDTSVAWDSVQARQVMHVDEDEWEEARVELADAEERDEYVPREVEWVRATWNDTDTNSYGLDENKVYQDNLICNQCSKRPARPVVTITHFREGDGDVEWSEDGCYALCKIHDSSVTPAVARAWVRRLLDNRKKHRAETARVKRRKELAEKPPT